MRWISGGKSNKSIVMRKGGKSKGGENHMIAKAWGEKILILGMRY